MLIVILLIGIVLIVLGIILFNRFDFDLPGLALAFIGGIAIVASILASLILGVDLSYAQTCDEKIAMYEAENAKIENSISVAVESYMRYEKETYSELSIKDMNTENIMTLVSLFPTLSSDKLVQSQIETMVTNNQSIKSLKEQKINTKVARWWLYFG